ncbi:MAG: HD domain-containing protein [Mariprofundaceae bacterium]
MARLLIVEDQPAVREVVGEIAEGLDGGIEVVQAGSIREARDRLREGGWDALVADMNLGDGNMLEFIGELKAEGVGLPPTALMSGFMTPERMAQALDLGVAHVLAKPFDPEALLGCLETMLVRKPSASRAGSSADRSGGRGITHDRLLPEMFDMDRRLGLVYRMFDELDGRREVSGICAAGLNLALEMVHARRGFLALFERKERQFVMVASEALGPVRATCSLDDTAFTDLMLGHAELMEGWMDANRPCWPGVADGHGLAVPLRMQGVPMGVLCMLDPASTEPLPGETRQLLGLLVKRLDTLLDNRAVHAALADSMRETLFALVRSLEARDRYTRDHSSRVSQLAVLLARRLQVDDESIQLIRTGGLLHDIGKVGVPDAVLLKPGRYTDHEYAIMKAHPGIGDAILRNMDTLVRERLVVRHHHERWDGKGYPDRIGGEEIPLEARIVCVADAIDAMTTHRVYRMARPLSFCAEQIERNAGTQFDPEVARVALEAIRAGQVQTQATPEGGEGVMPLSADRSYIEKEFGHG